MENTYEYAKDIITGSFYVNFGIEFFKEIYERYSVYKNSNEHQKQENFLFKRLFPRNPIPLGWSKLTSLKINEIYKEE